MSHSIENHSFSISIAAKYGVQEAILIAHFVHWIRINTRARRNFREFEVDGQKFQRYFTYQSRKEIQLHFPYWTFKQIRCLCEKLVELGILFACNFNKNKIDKTLWYAFVDPGEFGLRESEVDQMYENSKNVYESPNGPTKAKKGTPIPDTKTTDTLKKKKHTPPTPSGRGDAREACGAFVRLKKEEFEELSRTYGVEVVKSVIDEINDYLASTGNKPYKDYAATIRNWIRRKESKVKKPAGGHLNDSGCDNALIEGDNRSYLKELVKSNLNAIRNDRSINVDLYEYVEFQKLNSQPVKIYFKDRKFKDILKNELRKKGWNF